jgi:hypothetical protein
VSTRSTTSRAPAAGAALLAVASLKASVRQAGSERRRASPSRLFVPACIEFMSGAKREAHGA